MVEKVEELTSLFGELSSAAQIGLVESLLDRFEIANEDERYRLKEKIANEIIESYGSLDDTIFVAMTPEYKADSGQAFLQEMKAIMIEHDVSIKTLNNFAKINGKSYRSFRRFIIVDEFVGSGKTIKNRIKNFRNLFPDGSREPVIAVLVGMDYALQSVENETGVRIICPKRLKRGIRDYFKSYNLLENDALMQEIERDCFGNWDFEDFESRFSLGYGQAQALFNFKHGHVPNNVFPLFWWPFARDDNEIRRKRLFFRYEEDFQKIKRGRDIRQTY